jgi:hypothetical protein
MIEGEKIFDISTRLPINKRRSVSDILDTPIDIINNTVIQPTGPNFVPSAGGAGQTLASYRWNSRRIRPILSPVLRDSGCGPS